MTPQDLGQGPPLGNVQPPDWWLRIVQNFNAVRQAVKTTHTLATQTKPITLQQLQQIQQSLQNGQAVPLNVTGLQGSGISQLTGDVTAGPGSGSVKATLASVGPGAGTYTVGAKLTPAGQPGTITLDAQGRVVAVQQAT